jgi:hypothetical protein
MVFEILGHFLFMGDGTTLYGHDLHTCTYHLMILDTRNKNIYMCLGVNNSNKCYNTGSSGEEAENVKVYRETDPRQRAIRKAQLSFQIR